MRRGLHTSALLCRFPSIAVHSSAPNLCWQACINLTVHPVTSIASFGCAVSRLAVPCLTVPPAMWVWSQKLTNILDLLQTKDQTCTAGNLALQDSLRLKVPVRVVRGSHEKIKCASNQHVFVSAVAASSCCYLADMVITNNMADVMQSCVGLGAVPQLSV